MHAGPGILADTTHASGRSEVNVHAFLLEKAKYAPLKHFALYNVGSLFRMLSQRTASSLLLPETKTLLATTPGGSLAFTVVVIKKVCPLYHINLCSSRFLATLQKVIICSQE